MGILRLPSITGRTEKEQIAQLKDYLFQLVGDLQFELNKTQSVGTVTAPQKAAESGGRHCPCEDFVVERGDCTVSTAGIAGTLTYQKWKGGTYTLFGSLAVTPTVAESSGALYQTEMITVPLPFAIHDDAVVIGMGTGHHRLTSAAAAGESALSFIIISDEAISTDEGISVRLHALGTYVTTEEKKK